MTIDAAEAVLTFLRSVGSSADAEYYLRIFRDGPRERFAAIAVDAATMADSSDAVALDLRFLSTLDLTPVVILGLRDADNASRDASRLAQLLTGSGVAATTFGTAQRLDAGAIASSARAATIPIVTLTASDFDARVSSLTDLLTTLATRKLIFLRNRGGLRLHGERLSVVNVSDELEALSQASDLDGGDRRVLAVSAELLERRDSDDLLVSLTSPINLLQELFTVKGAGTLLRRGALITRCDGLQGIDRQRLTALLTESFGRAPLPQLLDRSFAHTYVDAHYRGAALLDATDDWGYLTKFAVTRRAQGEGLGRDLWQAISTDYPRLVWRARQHNAITPWYEAQCDGRLRNGDWTVYFRGIEASDIAAAVDHAMRQPEDFQPD